ncbi:MAG TPA: GxxExxY protein [Candidatus Angelobacter sp.]|jgi:GxxExxY protein|nr:GxxExxY protein [Candidatus Angelobacter sp.]
MSEAAATKLVRQPATANEVSHVVITAAMKVHSALGPGLLESAYEACLAHELKKAGLKVETQLGLPVIYDGIKLDLGYRIDMLVNDLVVVELKSVEEISRIHVAQVLSYMKLSKKQLGLIINFNVLHLKDGIKRLVEGTGWK